MEIIRMKDGDTTGIKTKTDEIRFSLIDENGAPYLVIVPGPRVYIQTNAFWLRQVARMDQVKAENRELRKRTTDADGLLKMPLFPYIASWFRYRRIKKDGGL